MDLPIGRCVFCMDLLRDKVNYVNESLLSSLTDLCFQKHPDLESLRLSFVESMEDAIYCTSCFRRVTEIHNVQKNLKQIQERLTHLTSTLEAFVTDKYNTFKEDENTASCDGESPPVVQLRIQLYKCFHLKHGKEETETDFQTEKRKVWQNRRRSTSNSTVLGDSTPGFEVQNSTTPEPISSGPERFLYDRLKRKTRRTEAPFLSIPKIVILDPIMKTESAVDETVSSALLSHLKDGNSYDLHGGTTTVRRSQRNIKAKTSSRRSVNKMLRCTFSGCNKILPTESQRFAHIRRDHEDGSAVAGVSKPFSCEQCQHCFTTTSRLAVHRRTCHEHPGKTKGVGFPCTVAGCKRKFSQASMLFCHVKKIHEGLTSFKCAQCNKEYPKPSKLRVHERVHSGELPFECPICQKRFITKQCLKQHSSLHNNKFACNICGKPCATLASLRFHLHTHSGAKTFICELCGYSCTSKQYLDNHQANQHQGETDLEPIKCHVCGKCLASKASLQSHLVSIHKIGEAKFKCPHCTLAFMNEGEQRKHMNIVHLNLKRYECMICNKKFGSPQNVRMHHQRQHIPKEERERPFECPTCGKRFFLKNTLENHVVIHTSERPFPCEQCNKRFPTKSYLDLHKYTIHDKRKRKSDANSNLGELQNQKEYQGNMSVVEFSIPGNQMVI